MAIVNPVFNQVLNPVQLASALGRRASAVPLRLVDGLTTPVRASYTNDLRRSISGTSKPPPRCLDPELSFLPPDGVARLVHSDLPSMLIGGISALLLQSLHPLAMAGVAEHSNYQSDPLGRLRRTATFVGTTTFGSVSDAEQAIAQVQRVHRRVLSERLLQRGDVRAVRERRRGLVRHRWGRVLVVSDGTDLQRQRPVRVQRHVLPARMLLRQHLQYVVVPGHVRDGRCRVHGLQYGDVRQLHGRPLPMRYQRRLRGGAGLQRGRLRVQLQLVHGMLLGRELRDHDIVGRLWRCRLEVPGLRRHLRHLHRGGGMHVRESGALR